ncbi:MAG: hypothetical protein JWL90_1546 [Chthoniobacteraceae bacterium]|nr:hypothetical protein [Chthoniobacteraceae bacterium]
MLAALQFAPEAKAVTAGEFYSDPPTLHSLAFRWFVEGDENGNATVAVDYRETVR